MIGTTAAKGVDQSMAADACQRAEERSRAWCSARWGVHRHPGPDNRPRCRREAGDTRCADGEHAWPCSAPGCRGGSTPLVGAPHGGCANGHAAKSAQELLRERREAVRELRHERHPDARAYIEARISIIDHELAWRRSLP